MVKDMSLDWNPWSLRKHNHVFVKISVSFLLMGLAFRLFFSDSIGFSSVTETPLLEKTDAPEIPVKILLPPPPPPPVVTPKIEDVATLEIEDATTPDIGDATAPEIEDHRPSKGTPEIEDATTPEIGDAIAPEIEDHRPSKEKCDLFTGDWIPNPSGPIYTNETCHVIQGHQNCMTNGRPDSGYLYWRWNPRDCELPPFNPERFFELMRHKSWAFIGDSISRNHVQSLLCILSKVDKAVEVYHDREYKSKRWHFPSYNFTLSVIWSPFLVHAVIFEDNNGVSKSEIELYLDELDIKWTDQYQNFDYIVIAGGKWFLKTAIYYENDTIVGCHYCPRRNLTELGYEYAYRKALQLVLNFFVTSNRKASVLFRTSTPDHFENGEWFSGGTCSRTVPFKEGEINMSDVDVVLRNIELEEYEKAVAALGSKEDLKLMLLDTTRLSLLRPDGHPGPYRFPHPFARGKNSTLQSDCLHWCLPGPIDAWNDLVMELVVNS